MTSELTKLAAFAVSLLSFALLYKQFDLTGWETSAFAGGAILFFVIAVIIGKVFNVGIITSLLFSSILTAFIMWFITPTFSFVMIFVFFILLIIILAYLESEGYV